MQEYFHLEKSDCIVGWSLMVVGSNSIREACMTQCS